MKRTAVFFLFLLLSSAGYAQNDGTVINKNRFIEKRNDLYGVIDSMNKVIIPFEYVNIYIIRDKEYLYKNGNSYEFRADPSNKKVRLYLQTKAQLVGLSDLNGNIIIPIKYRGLDVMDSGDFYITSNSSNTNGVYDLDGHNVFPEEYRIYNTDIDKDKIFAVRKNTAQILDLRNPEKTVHFDPETRFMETTKHRTTGEQQIFQIIKKKNHYGLINTANEAIIPMIYDQIKSSESWGYYIIKKDGKFGLSDNQGKIVRKLIYTSYSFGCESIIFKRKGYKPVEYGYKIM